MKLVIGIGNPGKRYEGTRHNVGFEVLALLARRADAPAPREKFHSLVTEAAVGGVRTVLMLPQTYVNESGRAVRRAADWFGLELEDLLVVCDDFSLALGKLRLRRQGSCGGHNGLRSIAEHLGTDAFPRLRIGIGEVPVAGRVRMNPADYVLSRFLPEELEHAQEAFRQAVEVIETWICEGIEPAMNRHN